MAETDDKSSAGLRIVAARSAADVIAASASEAFGSAMVIWLLGGAAIGIAASFAGQMIPSLPPCFAGQEPLEGHHSGHYHAWWHAARGSAFAVFFVIFFVHSLWVGFRDGGGMAGRRMLRILANLRQKWFGLIVGNAIGAWVAVLVLGIVQNFSPWQMLWQAVRGMVLPLAGEISRFLFGESDSASLGIWLSWYNANQMKLAFWVIYLGGAFDDLGVPNFKTLARWGWRRMQKRKAAVVPPAAERGDAA